MANSDSSFHWNQIISIFDITVNPFMNFSGGISITVTGENVDSVKEPIMVVVVKVGVTVSIYYQVNTVIPYPLLNLVK